MVIAFLVSWWMTSGDRELAWQRACFDPETGEWPIGDRAFWRFLYEFASLPVLAVCVAAIAVLLAGFRWPRLRAWRRVAWYALSLLLLGPGLIANLWMKETWGRPRPREVEPFGGRSPYERVFELDFTGGGKSFPCGHATMGFYFLGAYFLLRKRFPAWSLVALIASLAWGGLIGYTRMVQGGHFATDVVWAAAVMWCSAALLFRVFRLDARVLDPPNRESALKSIPWPAKLGGAAALVALLLLVALATPYRDVRNIVPHEAGAATADAKGSIRIELGDADIEPADQFSIQGEAWGHGLPTSQISSRWEEEMEPDGTWRFKFFQRHSGHFTEIRQDLEIGVPWSRMEFLKLDLGPGNVRLHLPPNRESLKIELILRETELLIEVEPGAVLRFDFAEELEVRDESGGAVIEDSAVADEIPHYQIVPNGGEGGSVVVRRRENPRR